MVIQLFEINKTMVGVVQQFNNEHRRRSVQRYIAILCAFAVTIVITSPSLKFQPISIPSQGSSTTSCAEVSQTDSKPIANSISRGFRPVYVYSKANPPNANQYSQSKQDVLVIALTKANDEIISSVQSVLNSTAAVTRKPFFVDLAANDAVLLSNTLLLEKNGWEGVCIEPNPRYWYNLASYRTCTIVGAFLGGTPDEDGKEVDVKLSNGVYGGIVGEGMDNTGGGEEKRNLVSITTVFKETNVPKVIDYLSLDVEGAELLVMQNFPWEKYRFRWMTIERPKDALVDLLQSHGYKKVMTIAKFGEILFYHTEEVALSEEVIKLVAAKFDIKDYLGKWELPPSFT